MQAIFILTHELMSALYMFKLSVLSAAFNGCRTLEGCSQMTSAVFGVSGTPWCLCQPIISFWHYPLCFKLTTSFVNSPEPKRIIFIIQFISIRVKRICVTKRVQLSLVRRTKACFGWIPSNHWIFHHSSSFLMTLGPSLSAFVSFLSYR